MSYIGAIKRLYAYGLDNELETIDKRVSDKTTSATKSIAEIADCTNSDTIDEISELLLGVQIECAANFYEAGFRKAMDIMLDVMYGGAVSK